MLFSWHPFYSHWNIQTCKYMCTLYNDLITVITYANTHMVASSYPIFSHFLLPASLRVTPTHTLQTLRCGWTWAVFPDVIKCGFSRATLPHFTLLQLLLRPSPVITTYQPLGATSTPAEKGSRTCARGPTRSAHVNQVHSENEADTNRASCKPKHITRIENVSSFTRIGSIGEQMSTRQR